MDLQKPINVHCLCNSPDHSLSQDCLLLSVKHVLRSIALNLGANKCTSRLFSCNLRQQSVQQPAAQLQGILSGAEPQSAAETDQYVMQALKARDSFYDTDSLSVNQGQMGKR